MTKVKSVIHLPWSMSASQQSNIYMDNNIELYFIE